MMTASPIYSSTWATLKLWQAVEQDLNQRTIEVYELSMEVIRCDPTTVSGHHKVIKMMTGALDPMGMPVATDVVSAEKADDTLYIPIIERICTSFKKTGLLYVGDSKMGALETGRYIAQPDNYYLMPLALVG